ncbi:hypothetical protein JTB14_013857 [Gonioctena quinquepunctata]|nr:hypothetical protein JTB14_013857 [Gonioctena quinquepunctata]
MDDLTFFKRFRLLKETVIRVLELIEEEIEYPNDLNNSVTPINQLLTTLRFYASSGHLAAVADFMGIHESTASRIVSRLSRAIARLYPSKSALNQIVICAENFAESIEENSEKLLKQVSSKIHDGANKLLELLKHAGQNVGEGIKTSYIIY